MKETISQIVSTSHVMLMNHIFDDIYSQRYDKSLIGMQHSSDGEMLNLGRPFVERQLFAPRLRVNRIALSCLR